jgi:hypothetical protein
MSVGRHVRPEPEAVRCGIDGVHRKERKWIEYVSEQAFGKVFGTNRGEASLGRTALQFVLFAKYRVVQKDGLNFGAYDHKIRHALFCRLGEEPVPVVGASTHTRQLVPVFQVLCSLCGLTCVSYARNSL